MNKAYLSEDKTLVSRLKRGDMLAFDEIYNKYKNRLFNFALKLVKSEKDAEDIIQEVFVKLWQSRDNINQEQSFKSYLFTISYNTTVSLIRKNIKNIEFVESIKNMQVPEAVNNTLASIEYKELNKKLKETVDKLPTRQKEVYLLSREEELSYAEIAQKLNISVNTVENHMAKALKTIRDTIGKTHLLSVLLFISLVL